MPGGVETATCAERRLCKMATCGNTNFPDTWRKTDGWLDSITWSPTRTWTLRLRGAKPYPLGRQADDIPRGSVSLAWNSVVPQNKEHKKKQNKRSGAAFALLCSWPQGP